MPPAAIAARHPAMTIHPMFRTCSPWPVSGGSGEVSTGRGADFGFEDGALSFGVLCSSPGVAGFSVSRDASDRHDDFGRNWREHRFQEHQEADAEIA